MDSRGGRLRAANRRRLALRYLFKLGRHFDLDLILRFLSAYDRGLYVLHDALHLQPAPWTHCDLGLLDGVVAVLEFIDRNIVMVFVAVFIVLLIIVIADALFGLEGARAALRRQRRGLRYQVLAWDAVVGEALEAVRHLCKSWELAVTLMRSWQAVPLL